LKKLYLKKQFKLFNKMGFYTEKEDIDNYNSTLKEEAIEKIKELIQKLENDNELESTALIEINNYLEDCLSNWD